MWRRDMSAPGHRQTGQRPGAAMQLSVGARYISAAWRPGTWGAVLMLALAACASKPPQPAQPSIVGLWIAQEVAAVPVPADARVTLSLYGSGQAVGHAGCNNYSGSYKRIGDAIAFGPMISTKMACAPESMTLEQSYLATLAAATRAERRPDGMLALTTESGAQILFRRNESASLQE